MTTTRRRQRLTGALGMASLPLIAGGTLLIELPIPGDDEPGSAYVTYFAEHDSDIWLGAGLMVLGLAALLVFLAGMRGVLQRAEPGESSLPGLVLAAGAASVLFELAPVTLIAGTAGSTEFFEGFTLDPDTAQLALGLGWIPSIYAGVAAAVVVAATSLSARRSGALPTGFARAGIVVAPLVLFGAVGGIATLLFPVWALAAGVVLVVSAPADQRPSTVAAMTT